MGAFCGGRNTPNSHRPRFLPLAFFEAHPAANNHSRNPWWGGGGAVGAAPTVIRLERHPRAVLHPESAPPLLQTFDQKVEAFDVLGIEQTIVVRFTKAFAQIEAESFLRDVVRDRLQAIEVYLGRGFAFGRNREGNIELLRRVSEQLGFRAEEVPEVR